MTAAARRRVAIRPPMPRRTVRLRLTLLYGALFLASGAVLLAITYGLVGSRLSGNLVTQPPARADTASSGPVTAPPAVADGMRAQQAADLHLFLIQSGIALAIAAAGALPAPGRETRTRP